MRSIGKIFSFSATHHLPHHEGQCHGVHGHNWKLDVQITGPIQHNGPATGMIMDYKDLDAIVTKSIIEVHDHADLNNLHKNPTSEEMIETFARHIQRFLPVGVEVLIIRLWETEICYAEWTAD